MRNDVCTPLHLSRAWNTRSRLNGNHFCSDSHCIYRNQVRGWFISFFSPICLSDHLCDLEGRGEIEETSTGNDQIWGWFLWRFTKQEIYPGAVAMVAEQLRNRRQSVNPFIDHLVILSSYLPFQGEMPYWTGGLTTS